MKDYVTWSIFKHLICHVLRNMPWCLANFTSLGRLHLSRNRLIQSLASLQYLDLWISDNLFQIPISLTPLYNLPKTDFFHYRNIPHVILT
ncbi:hypothetical protein M5689_022965 [Euphorbia peplus]|nr:hypothetical protein M5689_022965 [Euphorbia peplus]